MVMVELSYYYLFFNQQNCWAALAFFIGLIAAKYQVIVPVECTKIVAEAENCNKKIER